MGPEHPRTKNLARLLKARAPAMGTQGASGAH
jgi:hypothetical protein